MSEDPSKPNSEINWENTYEEQVGQIERKQPEPVKPHQVKPQSLNQKLSYSNKQSSSRKKKIIIIEVVLCIVAFIFFIIFHNPGIPFLFIILGVCIWQISKKPKIKPYDYLYLEKDQKTLPSYLPNTQYDQSYLPSYSASLKTESVTKVSKRHNTELYKNFHKAAEYNTNWLDPQTQALHIDPDDEIILKHWTSLRINKKTSLGDSIKNFMMLSFYFGIYALITYFVTFRKDGNYNATVQALFLPVVPYIIVCYRGFDKFIKAVIASFLLMSMVIIPLYRDNLITAGGIPFLRYFIFVNDWFPGFLNFLFQGRNTSNKIQLTTDLLILVFAFEFILMVLYSVIKTRPYVDIVITRKAIFLRAKTKKSFWDIIINIFWIFINPFNISQYKEIQNRIRYNRMTANEGHHHDFSRIQPDAIQKLKKKEYSIGLSILISIVLIIIGIIPIAIDSLIWITLIGIGIIIFITSLRKRGTYRIKINVKRSKVEGSWILSHKFDIFQFDRVPESIARYFTTLK